jgi:hypothetical protein
MSKKGLRNYYIVSCLLILIFASFVQSCSFLSGHVTQDKKRPARIGKIVVLGFRPAMSQGREPGIIRSPFSGTVFMAQPIQDDVPDKMTSKMFDRIQEGERYEIIGPNQAKGAFASIVSSDQGISDREVFGKIGQSFSADAVIVGSIYRWREREGTNYSVSSPASVAFDLYLIEPRTRSILWGDKFDKTQKSLSENILDVGTFLKGKGRWMTAAELAELGLTELLNKSPLEIK